MGGGGGGGGGAGGEGGRGGGILCILKTGVQMLLENATLGAKIRDIK